MPECLFLAVPVFELSRWFRRAETPEGWPDAQPQAFDESGVVVTPILLDPGVLRRMGEEYAGKDCIQIDVDEVAGTEQGG